MALKYPKNKGTHQLNKYDGLTKIKDAHQIAEISTTLSKESQKICQIIGAYSKTLLVNVKKTVAFVYHNPSTVHKDTQKILAVPLFDMEDTNQFKRNKKILGSADKMSQKLNQIESEHNLRPDGSINFKISQVIIPEETRNEGSNTNKYQIYQQPNKYEKVMKNSGFIFSNQSLKKTRITQAFHFGEEFLDDETRTNNNKKNNKNYIISPRKNTRSGLKKITDNEK